MIKLDRQVAEALGYEIAQDTKDLFVIFPDETMPREFAPSTNWQQAGELLEEFNLSVTRWSYGNNKKAWRAFNKDLNEYTQPLYRTPQEAICKVIIALKEQSK